MQPPADPRPVPPALPWLVRIPAIFAGLASDVVTQFGAVSTTRLGDDYYLIKTPTPQAIRQSEAAVFARWNLPMEHTWPCHPPKMDGFIEKAAQTLWRKFGVRNPQGVFVGQLNPGSPDPYYRSLASNLRGRTLQLFPVQRAPTVEAQDPMAETLFCLVGKEGMFCGMQSPRAANGLYAGGSKYMDPSGPDPISRAGAKIAEALHYLLLYRPPLGPGGHWLELGAAPGGMTSELLARGQRVTAVDRAPLDPRLDRQPGLRFIRADAATFEPPTGESYDAILSDLNGPASQSIEPVIRLSRSLKKSGLVIFTLKVPRVESLEDTCALFRTIVARAAHARLRLLARTHLTYNRNEFTLFLEREAG